MSDCKENVKDDVIELVSAAQLIHGLWLLGVPRQVVDRMVHALMPAAICFDGVLCFELEPALELLGSLQELQPAQEAQEAQEAQQVQRGPLT